jgi:hypothetical protein
MRSILDSRMYQGSGARVFFVACLLATLFLSRSLSASEAGQASVLGAVTVTPSSLAMLVDHSENLSVVDSSGSPPFNLPMAA